MQNKQIVNIDKNSKKNKALINSIIKHNHKIKDNINYLIFFVKNQPNQKKVFKDFIKNIKDINKSLKKKIFQNNISKLTDNFNKCLTTANNIEEIIVKKTNVMWDPNIEFTKKLCKDIKSNIEQNLESINKIKTQDIAK